ncbi:MmyB family transcriptional regulator [Streptomyces sp. NPDC002092]
MRDRRFDVLAANKWARALAPMYEPGHNPAREELEADEDFRRLWSRHDARPARDEHKRFVHPVVGELALRRQALTVGGAEQQVIIVYQAVLGSPSAAALARLL